MLQTKKWYATLCKWNEKELTENVKQRKRQEFSEKQLQLVWHR